MGGSCSKGEEKKYNLEDHGHTDRDLFEDYVNGDKFNDLSGKVVAITGTSTGSLGYYLGEIAIRKNAKILLCVNRDSSSAKKGEEGLQELVTEYKSTTNVQHFTCDLQDIASVKAAGAAINKLVQVKWHGGLDVLICNSGIMATRDKRTKDGFEVQMQTNQLSHFLLTSILFPSLEMAAKNRGEARLVMHSSSARDAPSGDPKKEYFVKSEPDTLGGDDTPIIFEMLFGRKGPWQRYHQSKLANACFAMAMHDKLTAAGSKVKALAADPGVASSNLQVSSTAGDGLMADWQAKLFVAQGHSAENGSLCAGISAFGKDAKSGDFYLPESGAKGPPVLTIEQGVPLKRGGEKLTVSEANKANVWIWCEEALGIKFLE